MEDNNSANLPNNNDRPTNQRPRGRPRGGGAGGARGQGRRKKVSPDAWAVHSRGQRSYHLNRKTLIKNAGRSTVLGLSATAAAAVAAAPPPRQAHMDANMAAGSSNLRKEAQPQNIDNTPTPAPPQQQLDLCEGPTARIIRTGGAYLHDGGAGFSSKKTILSWLIELNLIEEGEQVYYMGDGREIPALIGHITKGGILCGHCQEEVSVWTFETHAESDLKEPYKHTFLDRGGRCLQHLMIAAWDKDTERERRGTFTFVPKETSLTKHDEACLICGLGGELKINCSKCPSAYHAECMGIWSPRRDWLCPYCICKFCKLGGDSNQLVTCSHCEKKFHWQCFSQRSTLRDSPIINHSRLYCGQSCKEIYEKLDSALEIQNEMIDDYCWRVIRPTRRFLPTTNQCLENNLKVAVACSLMNQSFNTIVDPHTGINLAQNVVFGCESNLTRLNFNRFYTFTMEKDDAVICAASLRIHSKRIAEMPFITTDHGLRRRGLGGMLMTVIEWFLCDLEVQNLVIPTAAGTRDMWKEKFGFNEITAELNKEITNYNTVMFPGAVRLFKKLTLGTEKADGGNGTKAIEEETLMDDAESGARHQLDLNSEPRAAK